MVTIKYRDFEMEPGNISVPEERKLECKKESAFADSIYQVIADMPITEDMLLKRDIHHELKHLNHEHDRNN